MSALQEDLAGLVARLPRITAALVALVVFLAAGAVAGRGVVRVLGPNRRAARYAPMVRRIVQILFFLVGSVLALHVMGLTAIATSFLATGGMIAVVLGFAFREIGENLLAGVLLAFDDSFDIDDLIETGGLRGVVRAIDLRHVHIRSGDGCDIFVPSAAIYRSPLHNFTRDDLRRGSFVVGIDYRDEPASARSILLAAVTSVPDVLEAPAPSVRIKELTSNYVELEAFFWVDVQDREVTLDRARSLVMEAGHRALLEAGFTFSSEVSTAIDVTEVEVRLKPVEKGPA